MSLTESGGTFGSEIKRWQVSLQTYQVLRFSFQIWILMSVKRVIINHVARTVSANHYYLRKTECKVTYLKDIQICVSVLIRLWNI